LPADAKKESFAKKQEIILDKILDSHYAASAISYGGSAPLNWEIR
jgi:hypothetical protein